MALDWITLASHPASDVRHPRILLGAPDEDNHAIDFPLCTLLHVLRQCVLMRLPVQLEVGRSLAPQRLIGVIDSMDQSSDWLFLHQGKRHQMIPLQRLEGACLDPVAMTPRQARVFGLDDRGQVQIRLGLHGRDARALMLWTLITGDLGERGDGACRPQQRVSAA